MILGESVNNLKIYLFSNSVDMRKQVNGLLSIIESTFDLDPYEKAIFVFCNKSRDKIKAIRWDENGFVLYYKRLEKDRFKMPDLKECTDGKINISEQDLRRLLYGLEMECFLKKRRYIQM